MPSPCGPTVECGMAGQAAAVAVVVVVAPVPAAVEALAAVRSANPVVAVELDLVPDAVMGPDQDLGLGLDLPAAPAALGDTNQVAAGEQVR